MVNSYIVSYARTTEQCVGTVQFVCFGIVPGINPFKAIAGHFDQEKLKKLYVDGVSIINTSNYANGSTNLLTFREK